MEIYCDKCNAIDRVARLLCERHQFTSPTRQPCAACVQDAADGIKETAISGFCESCFDSATELEEAGSAMSLDMSYDYPEYDPQTAHYEKFGRPELPNEY